MIKFILALLIFFPISAWSQEKIRFNHNLPIYQINNQGNKKNNDIYYNNINKNDIIPNLYLDGSGGNFLQVALMADGSLQQIDKNRANGVASLDQNGDITTKINNTDLDSPSYAASDLLSVGRTNFRSMIDGQSIVRITGAHRQLNPKNEDPWTDPDGVTIGGFATGRGVHTVMTCQNEGGMNLGACLSIWNSNSTYTGNRPGLSPVTGQEIASYGATLDSVVVDVGTKSSPPKVVAGSDIISEDGISRSIFFDSNSVYINPTLSNTDRAKIKQHQTLVSNVSTPTFVNRIIPVYGFSGINGFSGMINNWAFSTSCPPPMRKNTACDRLDVDTWVIPGGNNANVNNNPQIYATSLNNIDNHYDHSVTHPAIYVGARSKQFDTLYTCSLGDYDTAPSASGENAKHSLLRECENTEYDNELNTKISGKYHFAGLTLEVSSHVKGEKWFDGTPQTDGYNAWPDKSSRGIYLGGMLPHLLVLSPFTSPFVNSIDGNTIWITNPISAGPYYGDIALLQALHKNAGNSSMDINIWQQCDARKNSRCTDHTTMGIYQGLRVASSIGNMHSGVAGGYIRYGGDGTTSLCNNKAFCITLPSNTDITQFPGNLIIPLHTPRSSNESCEKGERTEDIHYRYLCISRNHWQREARALKDF